MNGLIFQGSLAVELQGDRALRYISRNRKHMLFEVIGFGGVITIYDSRSSTLRAMERILEHGSVDDFPLAFNVPAFAEVWALDETRVEIRLYETGETLPQHMLWIAVGIGGSMPAYNYVLKRAAPLDDGNLALATLYRRPGDHRVAKDAPSFSLSPAFPNR